jgi:hypothetical protein
MSAPVRPPYDHSAVVSCGAGVAFGFKSTDALIPLAMLNLGGHRPAQAVNDPRISQESRFPALTWGLDEQRTGEMWNSNFLVSWRLVRSGHDLTL